MVTREHRSPTYRSGVASRTLAAAAGGYGVAALLAVALAVTLPGDPLDRAMAASLLALLAVPLVAMLCFWVRSAARVWAVLLGLAAALSLLALAGGWWP